MGDRFFVKLNVLTFSNIVSTKTFLPQYKPYNFWLTFTRSCTVQFLDSRSRSPTRITVNPFYTTASSYFNFGTKTKHLLFWFLAIITDFKKGYSPLAAPNFQNITSKKRTRRCTCGNDSQEFMAIISSSSHGTFNRRPPIDLFNHLNLISGGRYDDDIMRLTRTAMPCHDWRIVRWTVTTDRVLEEWAGGWTGNNSQ